MHEAALDAATRIRTDPILSPRGPRDPPQDGISGAIPPRSRKAFHDAVLEELLDEIVASSRTGAIRVGQAQDE